jgi:methylmalonyl-CoA mutase
LIIGDSTQYTVFAPDIYSQLKGKAIVVIAGKPASAEELKAIGLDLFIHFRSNVPETLQYFNNRLGIQQ